MKTGWYRRTREQIERGLSFTVLSVVVNTLMGSLKFAVGLLYGSPALMAGALYSINDVLSSIAVNVSLRFASRDPNRDFPFGYEKAEFLATGMTGTVLMVAVTGVFTYQFQDLVSSAVAPPHITALGIAVVSIFVSGLMYRRAREISRELSSPALHTSAEHNKADAISSVAVVVGIGAAGLGFHVIDRIVAVFEIGHIVFLAGELLGTAMVGLMDRSLPKEDLEMIREACGDIPGVEDVAQLRSRRGSRSCWVDVTVSVSSDLSVGEAHRLTNQAALAIGSVLGESADSRVNFRAAQGSLSRRDPA